MTTRPEALSYAEAWASHADQAATDFRNVSYAVYLTDPKEAAHHGELRDQAEAMALMWAAVAKLLPKTEPDENAPANEYAQAELDTLREGLRNVGADPTNLQNLQAQLSSRTRQWKDATAELEQLRAARDRTIAQMQTYATSGSGGVNPRQVVNLLSLTWPDGNYEAAPEADRG